MHVYIVCDGSVEDHGINAVYTSYDAALKFADEMAEKLKCVRGIDLPDRVGNEVMIYSFKGPRHKGRMFRYVSIEQWEVK